MELVVAPVDHAYDDAPDAVSCAEDPSQILPGELMLTTGFGFTVTVTLAEELHPADVPVTE